MDEKSLAVRIDIKTVEDQADHFQIHYRVSNDSTGPVFFAESARMPYVLQSKENGKSLEIWMGIPPPPDKFSLFGAFELPKVRRLNAKASEQKSVSVKKPLELSSHFSLAKTLLPPPGTPWTALLVVGFGFSEVTPVTINRLEKLFVWQHLVSSAPFKLPPNQG